MSILIVSKTHFVVFVGSTVYHCTKEDDFKWFIWVYSDIYPLKYFCVSRVDCIKCLSYFHLLDVTF